MINIMFSCQTCFLLPLILRIIQVGQIQHVFLKSNFGISIFIHLFEVMCSPFVIRLKKRKESTNLEAFAALWNNMLCIIFLYFVQLLVEQLTKFFFAHGVVAIHVSIFVKGFLQKIHGCEDCLFLCHGAWDKNNLQVNISK